jgi:hypothetical protein
MAVKLPPIPRIPIGENFEWREWFRKLRELASSVAGIAFNGLDFTDSNITSILTRRHNDLQSLQGGASGQYYHLTATEHSQVSAPSYGSFFDYAGTTLTSNITRTATTIPVVNTAGAYPFPSANTIRIEDELITYTGITSTSFTGCTRGAYGTLSASHTSGTAVSGVQAIAANTAKAMHLSNTDMANNITLQNGSQLKVTVAGVYNLQWSGQFENSDTAIHNASVWLRVNGTDVLGTRGDLAIHNTHGANIHGQAIPAWNYFVRLAANDYVELWWSNDDQAITMQTYPPTTSPTRPGAASLIVTMNYISP